MPRRKKHRLPHREGKCLPCGGKDIYPDEIGAQLGLDFLANNPLRGRVEPVRYYPCPSGNGFHLTSQSTDVYQARVEQHSA